MFRSIDKGVYSRHVWKGQRDKMMAEIKRKIKEHEEIQIKKRPREEGDEMIMENMNLKEIKRFKDLPLEIEIKLIRFIKSREKYIFQRIRV